MGRALFLFVGLPVISFLAVLTQNPFTGNPGISGNRSVSQKIAAEDPKCTDCHSDLIEKKILHEPAKDGCDNCHQVNINDHTQKGVNGLHLTEKMPELCYTCHDGTKKDVDTTRVVHQAVKVKKLCLNCHSPHSTDAKKLLIADKKELCLTCHDKDADSTGKKLVNIKKLLKTSKVIHPAIAGGCTSCHKAHASTENFLLISAYPKGQYVAGNKDSYAVCWECHDVDLFGLAKTATSTNFRDGERNLHFLHVNREKGRSCSICHNVHATNNLHLIVDKVPFGEWTMPMNYTPSDSGGSCAPGCHGYAQYKR
ncbi:MAG: cytochrome c3 family protein [bacterium]